MDVDRKCLLCEGEEFMNNLFFDCGFSGQIWKRLLLVLGDYNRVPGNWEVELQYAIVNENFLSVNLGSWGGVVQFMKFGGK
ncbi:hypothetical protein LIER_36737 [Lithospermum erythrorhizon]|uniref:Reverse transcriptase zinc-binding domain-containing protein n=1 Tax=Lithospermum erythrorhizon TaxID=34254 RepID=A0AAV3P9X3_LITER